MHKKRASGTHSQLPELQNQADNQRHRASPALKRIYVKKILVDLTGEESNRLFQVLEDWERHLAQLDLDGLGVRDENPHP